MAGVLIAPRFNTLAAGDFFNLMVVAIAAAAIGRLVSLPLALSAASGLGFVIAEINTFLPRWSDDIELAAAAPGQPHAGDPLPRALRRAGVRAEHQAEPRGRRPALGRRPTAGADRRRVGRSRRQLRRPDRAAACCWSSSALRRAHPGPTGRGCSWSPRRSSWPPIFLSITVITGMAGQISLCQGAFAAIGAFTVFQLVDRYDMSVLLGRPRRRADRRRRRRAALPAGPPARRRLDRDRHPGVRLLLRLRLMKLPFVGGGETVAAAGHRGAPARVGPFDLANDKSFLVLAVIVLVIVAGAVVQLRAGTFGPDAARRCGAARSAPSRSASRRAGPASWRSPSPPSSPASVGPCWPCSRRT